MSAAPFFVYGKTEDTQYSVRAKGGEAIATCAYNTNFGDRHEWAQIVAAALNAYPPAIAKAQPVTTQPKGEAP